MVTGSQALLGNPALEALASSFRYPSGANVPAKMPQLGSAACFSQATLVLLFSKNINFSVTLRKNSKNLIINNSKW